MKKNTASQFIGVQMITAADGTAFTGTVSNTYTIDGGTQTAGATVTHEGNGVYTMPVSATLSNGDHIIFGFTGTGAIPASVQVYTNFPQTVDNDTKISLIPTTPMRGTDGVDTAAMRGTDGVDTATMRGTDSANTVTPLDAAGIRSAVGLATANMDTQFTASATATGFNIGKTGYSLTTQDWNVGKTGYSVSALGANVITAASIAAASMNGKGDWNIGKTGYALTTADWNVGKTGYALSTAGVDAVTDRILPPQNVAYPDNEFLMVDETDHVTPETGLTITATRSIDGGAFGAITGSIAEVANGIYSMDASAADMNGKIITFKFSATGAMDTFLVLTTSA